jgi:deazaflavin-dependent oxidoreductase (nitroreductase family)
MTAASVFQDWAAHQYCYLTTTGRVTGRPHTIEIWFVVEDGSAWLFTEPDGDTDWVRNLRREPRVKLRVGANEVNARAEVVEVSRNAAVRSAVAERYQNADDGLDDWAREALVVRVTLEA